MNDKVHLMHCCCTGDARDAGDASEDLTGAAKGVLCVVLHGHIRALIVHCMASST